jgi:hypothetical protein
MLNPKTNERELAYVAKITKISPIQGADNIELVVINGGWTCIAKKGEFKENDLCVYFEIDSKLPVAEWSAFMEPKHYKVKTMKLGKFNVVSQGLALPFSAFGWNYNKHIEGDFLTKELNVTYSVEEDNKRKASSNPDAKINSALARHPKIAKKWGKTIKKNKILRKLFLLFFGRKRDNRNWPSWVVKTDEERVENMSWILETKSKWYATEKIDGTSTTFTMKRSKSFKKPEYYVCSRNVVFDTPNKNCYYDTNVYLEMAEKYNMKEILSDILEKNKDLSFVTIQGETYGANIQKRDYSLKGHNLAIFNLIFGYKNGEVIRFNPREMTDFLKPYNLPCVPILSEDYILPDTIDELRKYVNSKPSKIDGKIKEGIVFRSSDGARSFKCVSPEFLLKYHA